MRFFVTDDRVKARTARNRSSDDVFTLAGSALQASGRDMFCARTGASMKSHVVVASYALWLFAIEVVFYLVGGNDETALQVIVICGVLPVVLQILLLGVDPRGLVAPVKLTLALLLVILLSYVVNATDPLLAPASTEGLSIPLRWVPVVFVINTAFILVLATVLAGCPDRTLLVSVSSQFCILSAAFLVYIDLTGEYEWGRLAANGIQPNFWGAMGLLLCLTAFARGRGLISAMGFTVGAYTMYLADSRSSMLALAAACLLLGFLYVRELKGQRAAFWLAILGGSFLAALVFYDSYVSDTLQFASSNLLKLDSSDRGIDSGFSGRTGLWSETIDLWATSPLFGVGFRQHEVFLKTISSAHNAYLAMLADTGLAGLAVYLFLVIGSLAAALGITDRRMRRLILAVVVSYAVYGFFERRAINSGNPYSILFLLGCFSALADRQLRKAARLFSTAPRVSSLGLIADRAR